MPDMSALTLAQRLDEKALEAAAIASAEGDARPWSNMPDETVCGYMGRDAHRENAAKIVGAYLAAIGPQRAHVLRREAEQVIKNLRDRNRTDVLVREDAAYFISVLVSALPVDGGRDGAFQTRVHDWMLACFGEAIAADGMERNHRFLEEALELTQACGCTASEAHQLVDYVFGRPIGEKSQEVGGVMVTLAALCSAHGLDMAADGETELARVWTVIDKIRAKQAAKPKCSPLPGPSTTELTRTPPGDDTVNVEIIGKAK